MSHPGSRDRRSHGPIAIGAICFGLGSMLVVRADTDHSENLPKGRIMGLADALDSDNTARVTAARELSTSDEGTRTRLGQIIAGLANLTVAIPTGVAVTNFPATQNVAGSVAVTNFPASQDVAVPGGVAVTNFPDHQNATVTNFPASQAVTGAVAVNNFPATQAVTGSVSITGQPYVQVLPTAGFPLKAEVSIAGGYVFTKAADDMIPFERQLDFPSGRPHACVAFEVPAPYRLVTETVTAFGVTRDGYNAPKIQIWARSAGRDMKYTIATDYTQPYDYSNFLDEDGEFAATHSVKLRLDSGIHHACVFASEGELTISGYLR